MLCTAIRKLGPAPFLILLCSCGQYLYIPNAQNVPLFREKGEVRATAIKSNIGTAPISSLPSAILYTALDESTGVEFQGAYSLSDRWGVMGNAAFFGGDEQRGGIWELGGGYHTSLGTHFVAELYAGFGIGNVRYRGGRTTPLRAFFQPDFGFTSRNFEAILSLRMCQLWYRGTEYYVQYPVNHSPDPKDLVPGSGRLLIEPAITLRFGPRSAKLQVQWCSVRNLGKPFRMADQTFSVGFNLNINNSFGRHSRNQK